MDINKKGNFNARNMKQEFIDLLPDKNICLLGLQGSRAFGMERTKDADYDYRGVFVETNEKLLSLHKGKQTITHCDSRDGKMDYVLHEVEKFFKLAMKGNPSVVHLFFVPKQNIVSDVGKMIIENREVFLGEIPLRKAFAGYAMSQILYLKRNHKFTNGKSTQERIRKHIRHCFRLFDTGLELLETGKITMPLKDPKKYFEIEKLSEDKLMKLFEEKDKEFKECKSVLKERPNEYLANLLLLKIRGITNVN